MSFDQCSLRADGRTSGTNPAVECTVLSGMRWLLPPRSPTIEFDHTDNNVPVMLLYYFLITI